MSPAPSATVTDYDGSICKNGYCYRMNLHNFQTLRLPPTNNLEDGWSIIVVATGFPPSRTAYATVGDGTVKDSLKYRAIRYDAFYMVGGGEGLMFYLKDGVYYVNVVAASTLGYRMGGLPDNSIVDPSFFETSATTPTAVRPDDVTTRLAEAEDRAAKAEARAGKAEAALIDSEKERCSLADKMLSGWGKAYEERDTALAQVADLTARAEKAEHLLEMEQGSREAWHKEATESHARITAAEAQIVDLTAKLDDTRVDLALANEELFFLRAGAKDDADKIADLTAQLDEARGAIRNVMAKHDRTVNIEGYGHQAFKDALRRLAAIIAPETGKDP